MLSRPFHPKSNKTNVTRRGSNHSGTDELTSESGTLPHASRHQLERASGDFLAGAGHADHDRNSPSSVARFKGGPLHDRDSLDSLIVQGKLTYRLTHHAGNVSDALKRIIDSPLGELDYHLLHGFLVVFRVDEFSHAELFGCRIEQFLSITIISEGYRHD